MSPLLTSFATNFWNLTAEQIKDTIEQYASCGVTTVHDMLNSLIEPIVYHSLGDSLPIDVRGYFYVTSADLSIFEAAKEYQTSRFKVAGTKIILDGSIQGYTALLSRPYWVPQSIEFSDLSNYTYNTSRSCLTESCGVNDFPDP
jgi:predicted amidohydrolase YtcJ